MKRRIGIKNSSPLSASLVQDFKKKHFRAGSKINYNSGLVAETSGDSLFSTSTSLNVPIIRKPSTSQRIANATEPIRSDFSSPSSTSVRPSEQIATDQHAILNPLTTFHMYSHSSYTPANGHIVNFVTTTTPQYHIVSPLWNNYFGLMMEPTTFPTRYPGLSVNEVPFSNLPAGNPWFPMPMIADRSAASLSRPTYQPSSLYKHHPNYN